MTDGEGQQAGAAPRPVGELKRLLIEAREAGDMRRIDELLDELNRAADQAAVILEGGRRG